MYLNLSIDSAKPHAVINQIMVDNPDMEKTPINLVNIGVIPGDKIRLSVEMDCPAWFDSIYAKVALINIVREDDTSKARYAVIDNVIGVGNGERVRIELTIIALSAEKIYTRLIRNTTCYHGKIMKIPLWGKERTVVGVNIRLSE